MILNKCARRVLEIVREHKLTRVDSENLIRVIKECGYEIKEFRPYSNEDKTQKLLEVLNIKEFANGEDALTYADLDYRIVFISKMLSEKEKRIVLSHELGHICLNHMCSKKYIKGQGIEQEKEANEFSHYLLDGSFIFKACMFLNNYRERVIAIIAGLLVAVFGINYVIERIENTNNNLTYYITENGEKYHEKGCKHLDVKSGLKSGKREKLEKDGFSPCGDCLGGLQ